MKIFLITLIFHLFFYKVKDTDLNQINHYSEDINNFNKFTVPVDDLLKKLLLQTTEFLYKHSNESIIDENINNDPDCQEALYNAVSNFTLLSSIIDKSGKSLGDVGLREDCQKSNMIYMFLQIKANLTTLLNNTEYFYLYTFLEQDDFFTGYCLVPQCQPFYKNLLDKSKNQQLFKYMEEENGVLEIHSSVSNEEPFKNNNYCQIILFIILGMLLIKLSITIYGIIIFKINYEEKKNYNYDYDDTISDEDETGNSNSTELFFNKNGKSEYSKFNKYSKMKLLLYVVFKLINFQSHFKYLTKLKNKYYDDTKLEFISFLRAFAFLFIIINHNIFALIKIPHRDFTNYSFFTQFWFCIVKFSTFFCEIWILIDGFLMSYKLMSFLKKSNQNNIKEDYSIKTFLRFYGIVFTKFILFYFIFFILHIYLRNFAYFFMSDNPIFNYFLRDINDDRRCFRDPLSMFIPFSINYSESNTKGFTNCYKFACIYTNEFYSFTFMIFIFYLAYKFKSKIFDFSILILLFINIIVSFLSYADEYQSEGIYTFGYVLGETKGLKFTHLFMNTYILGNFSGLIYFYYNDIISTKPTASEYGYIPFKFCYILMKMLDRSSKIMKSVLFYLSVLIMVILSMSFYIILLFNKITTSNISPKIFDFDESSEIIPERDFNIKISPFMLFIYIYEKKIFQLAYIVMMLCSLIHPKVTPILTIVQSNLFVSFNRIDVTLMCISDICVYIFYSIYSTQIYLNIMNVFTIATGLMIIILIISYLIMSFVEMPFRIIYKKLFRLSNAEK